MPTNKPDTLKQGLFGRIVSSCKPEANHTLKPDLYPFALGLAARDVRHEGGEVFLNASMAYSFCA